MNLQPTIEKLAGGFGFTEGPIWMRGGFLVFSDIPRNTIYKWDPATGEISVFLHPSGYDGPPQPEGSLVGSNGLTLDSEGRLILCEHANRRVTRLESDGTKTVLASHYEGKRLNSPNDLVHNSKGVLYFTDPPYGLLGRDADPGKELPFNGVFRIVDGQPKLLWDQLTKPNGLVFSPDESVLYVGNSDPAAKLWMRFEMKADGRLGAGDVFYDATSEAAPGNPDGMKVDVDGNCYFTGPGGIWVITPGGKHLTTIGLPEIPANLHWGGEAGDALYVTARTGLYRVNVEALGIRP